MAMKICHIFALHFGFQFRYTRTQTIHSYCTMNTMLHGTHKLTLHYRCVSILGRTVFAAYSIKQCVIDALIHIVSTWLLLFFLLSLNALCATIFFCSFIYLFHRLFVCMRVLPVFIFIFLQRQICP